MGETVYPYHDQNGNVVYEAVRTEPGINGKSKSFSLRRVLPNGTRESGAGVMDGVVRLPYLLPAVIEAVKQGETIYFVEGEKCVRALVNAGRIATTRSEGNTQALDDEFLSWFNGAHLIVLPDCDAVGRQAGVRRAGLLARVAASVQYYDLDRKRMDGYDIADWLEEGNDLNDLEAILADVPCYEKPVIEQPKTTGSVEAAKIFSLGDLLRVAVKKAEDAADGGPRVLASPWQSLNYALGGNMCHAGFFPQESTLWAATPGGGKSSATWQVADHAAAKHEGTAVLVSAEMGEIEAVQRLISLYSGIGLAQMQTGQLSSVEWEKMAYVEKHLANRRLAIIGRDGRDLNALHKSLEIIASKTKISCVVVDHIGKITQKNRADQNRHYAMEEICESLANWAIEYDMHMHFIQHLNKKGYGKEPELQDLRDGGNTDGHVNNVIFPYRKFPDAQKKETREAGWFLMKKCRNGHTESLPMKFVGERYMWVSTEENNQQPWFEVE